MAMSAKLKVDLGLATRKLESFKSTRQKLSAIMQAVKAAMIALATVSWISPASAAILQKFLQFYRQLEEALKIVDEYIHDLQVVLDQYTAIEQRLQEKAKGLRTDVFGV